MGTQVMDPETGEVTDVAETHAESRAAIRGIGAVPIGAWLRPAGWPQPWLGWTPSIPSAPGPSIAPQLSLFDGYTVDKAAMHVTAGVEIHQGFSDRLPLGGKARITVRVGDEAIEMVATVTKRGFALEKNPDGGKATVTRHVLVADPETAIVV